MSNTLLGNLKEKVKAAPEKTQFRFVLKSGVMIGRTTVVKDMEDGQDFLEIRGGWYESLTSDTELRGGMLILLSEIAAFDSWEVEED